MNTNLPSDTFQTLEATLVKGYLSVTSNSTIIANSVSLQYLTDSIATLHDGRLTGLVNSPVTNSAVNKEYVDSVINIAPGSLGNLLINNNGLIGATSLFNYNNVTKTLYGSGSSSSSSSIMVVTNLQTSSINISGITITASTGTSPYSMIFPNTIGFSNAVLQVTSYVPTTSNTTISLSWTSNILVPSPNPDTIQYNNNGVFQGSPEFNFSSNILFVTAGITVTSSTLLKNSSTTVLKLSDMNLTYSNTPTPYTITFPSSLPSETSLLANDGTGILYYTLGTGAVGRGPLNSIQYSDNIEITGSEDLLFDSSSNSLLNLSTSLNINCNIIGTTMTSVLVPTTITRINFLQNYAYICGIDKLMIEEGNSIIFTTNFSGIINAIPLFNNLFTITSSQLKISSIVATSIGITLPTVSTMSIPSINQMSIYGSLIYISAATSVVVSYSNILNPTTIATFGTSNYSTVYDNNLFSVSNTGLSVYNKIPTTTINYISLSGLNNVSVNNNYIYTSNSTTLYLLNSALSVTTTVSISGLSDFILNGNEIFARSSSRIYRVSPTVFSSINVTTLSLLNSSFQLYNGVLFAGSLTSSTSALVSIDILKTNLGSSTVDAMSCCNLKVEDSIESLSNVTTNNLNVPEVFTYNVTGNKTVVTIVSYGAVTCNSYFGKIILSNPIILILNESKQLTVNNSLCRSDSIVNVAINKFTLGLPVLNIQSVNNGSFVVNITNKHPTEFMSSTLIIVFSIH